MDFVIFSTINWDSMTGAHRPVRWARELVRRGHRVLYVEAQPSRMRPAIQDLTIVSLLELGLGEREFRRAWLGVYPGELQSFENTLLDRLYAFEGGGAETRVVLWCSPFVPFVLPLPELRERGYCAVYDCIDDVESLGDVGYWFGNSAAERYLVRECDLTVVVSTPLFEKLRSWNTGSTIRLLRQGFDPAEFRLPAVPAAPPPDLVRGERTLGFWGLVNDFNVDPDLLSYVACEHPNWTINLIGPVDPDPQQKPVAGRLRAFPNIHLLGEKAHARLADYLIWFDVTLIPFPSNAFNLSRDPLKVLEYLSGYKPVVSAHTPQLAGIPHVHLADTPESFLSAIERALKKPVDRAELDAYLVDCTWSARVDRLLAWIAEQPRHTERLPAPTAEQFYPPVDLPANLLAYVTKAEQLLAERRAYIEQMEGQWRRTRQYLLRLERTHPAIRLRRAARREGSK